MKTYKLTNQTKGLLDETLYYYKSDDKGLVFWLLLCKEEVKHRKECN